jgi:hypothetical protein
MAIIQSGVSGNRVAIVDPTMLGLHMTERPPQVLGSYQIAAQTGALTTISSNNVIYEFRWAPAAPTIVCQIRRIEIGLITTTAFGTAQNLIYSLFINRNFTTSGSGGSTLVQATNTTSVQNKLRTSMVPTAFSTGGTINIASTVALTSGTRVRDTNPITYIHAPGTAALTTLQGVSVVPMYLQQHGDYPITLAQNEGFEIVNTVTMGATGVVSVYINVEWTEAISQLLEIPDDGVGTRPIQY